MVLPPPPPAAQPRGRGAAPALPLPGTIQVGPGRAGLGPCSPLGPPAPSPVPPAPSRLGWRRSRRKAHTSLKLVASSLPRLPPLRLPAPEPGRPMPAPAPPAWLHKVAEKPPPARAYSEGPEGLLGSSGSAAPAMCRASRTRRTAERVAARHTHALSPLQPAPPSTHLSPAPTMGAGEPGSGVPGPSRTPCPPVPLT